MGWVASEEDFFKELFPQVERFKLRASFGILGSDNVDPFLYRKQYAWAKNSTVFGTTPQAVNTLYNKVSYPMENLTWEKCRSINVGFELSAWNGLLGIEFDVSTNILTISFVPLAVYILLRWEAIIRVLKTVVHLITVDSR
ncbi:hypothetical protein BFINE_42540 [Bacteroides finegoldii DSM 17565]|nr:hypothetical protein BFINE_42540 [Bacteroides finegoldii DSM 17565]